MNRRTDNKEAMNGVKLSNYLNTEKWLFYRFGAGFRATMDTALITAHINTLAMPKKLII